MKPNHSGVEVGDKVFGSEGGEHIYKYTSIKLDSSSFTENPYIIGSQRSTFRCSNSVRLGERSTVERECGKLYTGMDTSNIAVEVASDARVNCSRARLRYSLLSQTLAPRTAFPFKRVM